MAKFCTHCGAQLADGDLICSQCGTVQVSATANRPATDIRQFCVESPKPPKKPKWWMIAIPAVAVVLIIIAVLWHPILMKISPKLGLYMAASKTEDKLSDRVEASPLGLLLHRKESFDSGSTVAIDLNCKANNKTFKSQISLQSDAANKQWAASAAFDVNNTNVETKFYFDSKVAAASMSNHMDGKYYGLTYKSFAEDLQESAMSSYLSYPNAKQFSQSVRRVAEYTNTNWDIEQVLEPYRSMLDAYLENAETSTGKATIVLDDKEYSCDAVTLKIEQETFDQLLLDILDKMEEDENLKNICTNSGKLPIQNYLDPNLFWAEIIKELREGLKEGSKEISYEGNLVYYIRKGYVVDFAVNLRFTVNGRKMDIRMETNYGTKPGTSDIRSTFKIQSGREVAEYSFKTSTEKDGEDYRNTTTIASKQANITRKLKIRTKWNCINGKLCLEINAQDAPTLVFNCTLLEIRDGYQISIDEDNIKNIIDAIQKVNPNVDLSFSLKITVTKGCEIVTPEFVNLDECDGSLLFNFEHTFGKVPGFPVLKPEKSPTR